MDQEQVELLRKAGGAAGYLHDYEIAKAIGMAPETFSRKINGKMRFSTKEIVKLGAVLHLTKEQQGRIFL